MFYSILCAVQQHSTRRCPTEESFFLLMFSNSSGEMLAGLANADIIACITCNSMYYMRFQNIINRLFMMEDFISRTQVWLPKIPRDFLTRPFHCRICSAKQATEVSKQVSWRNLTGAFHGDALEQNSRRDNIHISRVAEEHNEEVYQKFDVA